MNNEQSTDRKFRVLILYPNLYMMLVPSLAVGVFTRLLSDLDCEVDLFETTQYFDSDGSSPQNRVKFAQARAFDYEKDLGLAVNHDNMFIDFRKKVLDFEPDLILTSAVEDVFLQAVSLLETIEDLKIQHLVGGVFPTAAPARCFEFPVITHVARGEGEAIVTEFVKHLRAGETVNDVPGVWYRDEEGEVRRNPNPPLININDIRPDYRLFAEERFHRPMGGKFFKTVPFETYRGCPYACTFCNSPMQRSVSKEEGAGNFLRRKTIKVLQDEMRATISVTKPEFFYFIDDSFLARPKKEIFEFCDMYEEFKIPFWFNTRPENCFPEAMKRLKEVGAYRISFGIECGNEQFRKNVLLRSPKNTEIIESFKNIHASGIPFSVNLIIGFPGETREHIMDTVELVRSIDGFDTLTVSIFTPYHGTTLRAIAVQNGWLDGNTITKHTTSKSLLEMPPPYVSSEDIDGLAATLPLYCYFPKDEWEAIRRAETPDEEGLKLREEYQEIYRRDFLREDQFEEKILVGGTGCRSNPKDSFRISEDRLTAAELESLTIHA